MVFSLAKKVSMSDKKEEIPFYKKCWIFIEMTRSDNRIELKNNYRRIFNETLTDSVIQEIFTNHMVDINTLKELARADLQSHELANPKHRMDRYQKIAKTCNEGFYTGAVDATGMPIIKVDPKTELEAIKAAKEECNMEMQNQIKLLQIAVMKEKLGSTTYGGEGPTLIGQTQNPNVTITVVPPSDNDDHFE
jgi:hypothetical protein